VRIDNARRSRLHLGHGDMSSLLHCPQRPADAVVFEVGGDGVIASFEHALEGHVQAVGGVQGEDESCRVIAFEELVEQVTRVLEDTLRGQRHAMASTTWIGQRLASKLVERAIDALRLGKTRRGVIEVDHEFLYGVRRYPPL